MCMEKVLKMTSITSKEFGRRFRKALSVPFVLNQVCSPSIHQFVTTYASSLGCSEKCVFFPLLTCCAACMGINAHVELTADWQEPPLLWTLVITPSTLRRIDVAEHMRQQLLQVQNDLTQSTLNVESSDQKLRQFVIDLFKFDELQAMLTENDGHGIGLYNSARILHGLTSSPLDAEIMLKLHAGSSWFTSSKSGKILSKTRVNFSIISKPSIVHDMLQKSASFPELFQECFLTVCAEEKHVKFGQLSSSSSSPNLKRLFQGLMELHMGTPIIYKLSPDARVRFGQIHDELTDKAKQMSRKNPSRVFRNALSYLARLCCVLHVFDNIVEAVNWNLTLDPLTWNTEISANTVWHARQILSFVIEQKYALSEETTIEVPSVRQQSSYPVMSTTNNLATTPNASVSHRSTSNSVINPRSTRESGLSSNISDSSRNHSFNVVSNVDVSNTTGGSSVGEIAATNGEPTIVSVRSAGLPVMDSDVTINPSNAVNEISNCSSSSNSSLPPELSLPPSLSVSVISEPQPTIPTNSQISTANTDTLGALSALTSHSVSASNVTPQTRPASFMTNETFFYSYKTQIRRILIYGMSELSPSRCVQLKLTPDPTSDDPKKPRFTSSFARCFLNKLAALGFGLCEGPSQENAHSRHYLFKKKSYKDLGIKQKQLLSELRINEKEYDRCFTVAVSATLDSPRVNARVHSNSNSVVVLE